jgi:hypothetical protein
MMYALKIACWSLIFIFKLRFPPGISIATIQYQYLFYILYNTMQSDSGYDNSRENVRFMYSPAPTCSWCCKKFSSAHFVFLPVDFTVFYQRALTEREFCTVRYRTEAFQFIIWLN